jgi:hypothetical protein
MHGFSILRGCWLFAKQPVPTPPHDWRTTQAASIISVQSPIVGFFATNKIQCPYMKWNGIDDLPNHESIIGVYGS